MMPTKPHTMEYYELRAREMRAQTMAQAFRALGDWLRGRVPNDPKTDAQTA